MNLSDVNYMCEFNPPPLFEKVLGVKPNGKFIIKYNIKSNHPQKVVGGKFVQTTYVASAP